ncbi:hypothetical protein LzC2_13350 [Planctomycetes bacterium LzC2]|uniref:Uncharacterized protein n=1 Tax=Alienimonas chondri TaxID=2681879 RepID=A0ABX1VBK8_9PLAN|nr:hypothetical protein [Alienimonas chondri]
MMPSFRSSPRKRLAVLTLFAALLPLGCGGEGESGMVDPGVEGPPESIVPQPQKDLPGLGPGARPKSDQA